MADKFKACSVEGCNGNSHYSKLGVGGLCNKHYKRLLRHGAPELGRTPQGEPHDYFLNVVLPYEGGDCLVWPYGTNGAGYGQVTIDGVRCYVHRLSCEEENGPPPSPDHEAAHSCGKGHLGCVSRKHLSWKTSAGNKADMVAHGTRNRGERHGQSKLTEESVKEILRLKGVETQEVIAKRFGVAQTTVSHVMRGDSWAWLHEDTDCCG